METSVSKNGTEAVATGEEADSRPEIEFSGLRKTFGEGETAFTVFSDLSFRIKQGSFTSIMGPSGCGKSTLLNLIAGLLEPDEGTIYRDEIRIEPGNFFYAYVFQEPRLLDWRTVGENIAFALRGQGILEEEYDERIEQYLGMVGLADEVDSYPQQLSGGMRQRVGIARALAIDPDILLMDEPFSSLDEFTAKELRQDLLEIWKETGKTIVFVTHNASEAVFLSDTVLVLDDEGEVFDHVAIDAPRPREVGNQKLVETESDLMDRFFTHLDSTDE